MKRLILFLTLLLALPLLMIAQVIEPPANWLDLFANIDKWIGTIAGVSAVTIFLAAAINTLLKTVGFVKQLVAWLVAIAVLVVGNLVNMGFMADLNWWHTLIYGVAAGFVSNGIFDIELVKKLLAAIGLHAGTGEE
jgi:hypothetical protein